MCVCAHIHTCMCTHTHTHTYAHTVVICEGSQPLENLKESSGMVGKGV